MTHDLICIASEEGGPPDYLHQKQALITINYDFQRMVSSDLKDVDRSTTDAKTHDIIWIWIAQSEDGPDGLPASRSNMNFRRNCCFIIGGIWIESIQTCSSDAVPHDLAWIVDSEHGPLRGPRKRVTYASTSKHDIQIDLKFILRWDQD